jgi:predicted kinase
MKKLKLLILSGIPGSGKSTWARKFIKTNSKEWIVVNRDSIRNMLGVYWIPNREGLVTIIEKNMITSALSEGYNVIIDATNLNPKTIAKWNELVAKFDNVEIETKKFNISLRKAIFRDWKRGLLGGRKVGRKVIKKFYYKNYHY